MPRLIFILSFVVYVLMQRVPKWQKTEAFVQPLTRQRLLSWLGLVVSNWANLNGSSSPRLVEKYRREEVFQVWQNGKQTNRTIMRS